MKKTNIRQINRQFYKYWFKESKEWRKNIFHIKWCFHCIGKHSLKVNIPIHELLFTLLVTEQETITVDDFFTNSILILFNKNTRAIGAILEIAGYEKYKELDGYCLVERRREKVLNACNATRACDKADRIFDIRKELNIQLRNYYIKRCRNYRNRASAIDLKYYDNAYKNDPANGERIALYTNVGMALTAFISCLAWVVFVSYSMVVCLNADKYDSAVMQACSTFIVTSFPCIATVITTFLLIKHEYKVDYHKERMGVLPVFSFEHVDNKEMLNGKGNVKKKYSDCFYNTAEIDDLRSDDIDFFKLKNMGKGIAFNVQHDRVDEIFTFGDIYQDRCCYIALRKYNQLNYEIEYNDLYGNKYTQFFDVCSCEDDFHVTSYPPALVLKTKRVRYQQ